MRRIIYNMVICCATAWFLAACSNEYDIPGGQTGTDGNSIILDISSGALPVSRATVPAEGAEVAVSHIDVLIFDATETKVWSDRVSAPANKTGKITLAAKRENFDPNAEYWVYLIANSTHAEGDFDNLANLNGLKAMTQEDENIHMTGLAGEGLDLPETFLMDGIAYPEGSTEPTVAAPVILYNGTKAEDTQLAVTLRRAAAKVVVTITKGPDVTFDNSPQAHGAGYYLRNMPYTTSVIAGVNGEAKLDNTDKTSGAYFNWAAEKITVTAYMYAHAWADQSSLEKEVRLVMNIPMTYSKDADPQLREDNYYQIPVCEDKVLNRNTCYMVTATVNAPGAENPSTPVTLTDVGYTVEDWAEEMIEVGGEDGRPAYLTLNEYDLEMHNMEDDNTTLIFTSSSKVTAIVVEAYYYDKFGQETPVSDDIKSQITITPDDNVSGHIKIHSPNPTNNTIRYIVVEVKNQDGNTRTVTIEQYPLEYITNIQGWYSYRSDFGGTNYEQLNGQNKQDIVGKEFNEQISNRYVGASWSNGSWNYSNSSGDFRSKLATQKSDGTSTISYYQWTEKHSGWIWPQPPYSYSVSDGNGSDLDNGRMYHVQISATSGDYTLGKPRITNGKTDPGKDNAKLVSPSFMIASQLGAVQTMNSTAAASHCEQYVEVYKDTKTGKTIHLDNWRLPTHAEVQIIMKFQNSSDAMDEVLGGDSYWSASGKVNTTTGALEGTDGTTYIRCIRDAYDDKK